MNHLITYPFRLLLLALLPLAVHAAPPPYWPGYPPPPYYYPPMPTAPVNRGVAPAEQPVSTPQQAPITEAASTTTAAPDQVISESAENGAVTVETAALPQDEGSEETSTSAITGEKTVTIEVSGDTDDMQEIATSIQQGNFAEAYYLWRPRADSGDADAQYGIGWMYHNGYGLAINDDKAIAWWELASAQEHTDATFALGMLYGLGEGPVRRDMELAISYYHQAARDGHQDARLLLRTLIAEGNDDARQLMLTLLNEKRLEEIGTATTIQRAKANVRKGPGTKHKVLTTLLQGHILLPLKREGRWLLMGIEGKTFTGWIHDSLIDRDILSNS